MSLLLEDIEQVWRLIQASHLVLKKDAVLEFYHHRGAEHFREIGAVFINIVNKEYCKSCAVLLPEHAYPDHYHKIKIETFFILYGDLRVTCEESESILKTGDIMSIERGQNHSFSSRNGAVFEELSTTHVKNDSIYSDLQIRKSTYEQRKTLIPLNTLKEMIQNV